MHLILTSSNESEGTINHAWTILHKRIMRKWKNFAYIKLHTDEGVHGVLHIIARNDEFITKNWLSENWSDSFQATVTWSVQCYGNILNVVKYLLGYLEHHDKYHLSWSQNWLWKGWVQTFKYVFSHYSFEEAKLRWAYQIQSFQLSHLSRLLKEHGKNATLV